ncbi:MAG: hypothetical protein QF492_04765 [Candidatus Krumholzibacteria bacterium]|jgi:hypothetical protein|nr:hypothetical protein [Candidatus Krumholzibacteria bacterium]MDP6669204.1 hypothetical protein [Candidatus Krumholzibacteria bacterium]MDP6796606.1 hypothetical protein [Candidatus Krumholzibacteria bacterium]MDP7020932.1 hypothetical protein [Candidatus Krumholzibacteria bacterium]
MESINLDLIRNALLASPQHLLIAATMAAITSSLLFALSALVWRNRQKKSAPQPLENLRAEVPREAPDCEEVCPPEISLRIDALERRIQMRQLEISGK